ncbi:glycoside hydrolase family 1 protein [Patescibacteria group bacterium]|nr:glycoside hydrolase family 1 protein [Patescibacteria group bacterium]
MMMSTFLYGAATSAHKVEGYNIHNDWWAWEKAGLSVVESGAAADHYNRFAEDFALAKGLGHNAHRLSLEWSRLELAPGKWNQAAFDHYREVLQELKRQELVSFVTLHHFTNPVWLAKRGGWQDKKTPALFARYAKKVAQELGELVDFWVTINEPMVYATQSYWRAKWPPQQRSVVALNKVVRNLALGHRQAYAAIHDTIPEAQVGLAKHLIAYVPEHRNQFGDRLVTSVQDWWFNHRFLALTRGAHDFIGVNFYFTVQKRVRLIPWQISDVPWTGPTSDLGWPLRAEGLTQVLLHLKRYGLPIYITENGLADAKDTRRADFIRDHLRAVETAQKQGVNIRGYFHWSLLDNFEWADGFDPRFGLIEVDYETQQRTPRPSAYVYKAIIEQAQTL